MLRLPAALLLLSLWVLLMVMGVSRVELRTGGDGDGDGGDGGAADGHDGGDGADGDDGGKDGADGGKDGADGGKDGADGGKDGADGAAADGGKDGADGADGHMGAVLGDGDDADAADGAAADGGADAADGGADGVDGADGDGNGDYRPKYGVINGQGCTGHYGCKRTTKQPYYLWAKLTPKSGDGYGGMLYFEHRGTHGEPVLAFIAVWMMTFFVMCVAGLYLKDVYLRPVLPPAAPGSVLQYLETYSPVVVRGTVAELGFSLWFLGWMVLCFLYVWNHATINNLVGPVPRGLGGIVVGLLALQLFPVSRNSVVLGFFGVPYERALKVHRKFGGYILLFTTAHMLGMWFSHTQYYSYGEPIWSGNGYNGVYKEGDSSGRALQKGFERLFKWDIGFPHGPPLAGFFAWLVMLPIVLVAAFLRHKKRVFFTVTHLGYVVLYPMAWIHYPSLMVFGAVPVILYVIDVCLRNFKGFRRESRIVESTVYPGITRLTVHTTNFVVRPGQWVSVRIPAVSEMEFHPFSVSTHTPSPDGSSVFTLHIKDTGNDAWTSKVKTIVPHSLITVHGPWGAPMVPKIHSGVVYFCAGGVGLTAVMSYLHDSVVNRRNLRAVVIWSYRGIRAYEAFHEDLMTIAAQAGDSIEWRFYDTSSGKDVEMAMLTPPKIGSSFPTTPGRPNWTSIIRGIDGSQNASVFACGPEPLVREVETACYTAKIPLHKEAFEL